ncbi:MAG: hypothetical protein AAGI53_15800 [Planctomycetota bacterium]
MNDDRDRFTIVVSPYHLTTREAPAIAAAQIADEIVTLVPAPMTGRDGVRPDAGRATALARSAPVYAEMMDSWSWCAELFREGIIGSVFGGDDAADDARAACDRIGIEEWLGSLRPLVRPELFDDDRTYLGAVATDVLRGGPDPALSIPLAAGLDAFAARHGLVVARAAATSIAQKAEAKHATRRAQFAVPALVQGSADRLLLARALFDEPLADLRAALAALAAGEAADVEGPARAYTEAFAIEREHLLAPPGPNDDDDEVRPVEGTLAMQLVELPRDVVFEASVEAAAVLEGVRSAPQDRVACPDVLTSLVVKVIGRR